LRSIELEVEPCEPRWLQLTVVPSGENWVVEVASLQFVLDGVGEVLASRPIEGRALYGATRAGGMPLVVRGDDAGGVNAALLDETGAEVWSTAIDDDVIEAEYGSAAAVEDGFLVALRREATGVEVVHLDGAGEITTRTSPGSEETEYPQLAAAGGEVRLVWTDFNDGSVLWSKLDGVGRPLGEAAVLGGTPTQFNRSPIALDGTDTVVLLGGYTGGTGTGAENWVHLVDDAGGTLGTDLLVQADPNGVRWPQVVMFEDSPVAAWVGGSGSFARVGVARVNL
jgi:hypothetical protein